MGNTITLQLFNQYSYTTKLNRTLLSPSENNNNNKEIDKTKKEISSVRHEDMDQLL